MKRFRPGPRAVTLALLLSVTNAAALRAQQTGPVLKSGAVEVSINGRVQTQLNTTSVEDEPASEVILRRVRLEALVKVNDVVSGKIQPDFAGDRVSLKDAYLRVTLDPALQLVAGKAHRPFSTITITSSTRILPVERGVRIRGVDNDWDEFNLVADLGYADRDVGLQLQGQPRGAPLGLSYAAGYFNGPARDEAGSESSYQLAARIGVQPAKDLRVAAAWSSRHFGYESDVVPGETFLRRGNAWQADVEIGSHAPGFHAVGEVAMGDFDPLTDRRFVGAQAWLAFRTDTVSAKISAVEPLFRVSHGSVDAEGADLELGGTLLTPGVNVYLGGLNRVMFNWDFWRPADGETQNSFKAQFQLAF
ncbi:MAG TPA: porin [Longimicrobium sp.]|nr:porin [Longimicrobium sp.]